MMTELQGPLLRYVVQLLWPDEAGSQDVVQNTFLRYHKHLQNANGKTLDNPKAWLFRVAHNASMDVLRRRQRHREIREQIKHDPAVTKTNTQSEVQQLETRELYDLALQELNQLPDEQKQVLLLKHIQGLTLREISEITGLNIGTVNYRLTQGLKALAGRIGEQ